MATTIFISWINGRTGANLFSFPEIFTYFLVGSIFHTVFIPYCHYRITNDISSGEITGKLLSTSNLWTQYLVAEIGRKLFRNVDVLLWIVIAIIANQFLLIPSFANFFAFLAIGFLVSIQSYLLSVIIGSTVFFTVENSGIMSLFDKLEEIVSGKLFPLNIIFFTNLLSFTPFAFTFYHPMQIYLGKYTTEQTFYTFYIFTGGIAWCFILYFLAKFVFKMGLKKNESVGL